QITIVVDETTGGGPGGGGGGGGDTSAAAKASAVKLSPAKPRAGSSVVASVRVTKGGSPLRPTGIACAASIGKVKVKGASRSASGLALCLFKTPKSVSSRRRRAARGSPSSAPCRSAPVARLHEKL